MSKVDNKEIQRWAMWSEEEMKRKAKNQNPRNKEEYADGNIARRMLEGMKWEPIDMHRKADSGRYDDPRDFDDKDIAKAVRYMKRRNGLEEAAKEADQAEQNMRNLTLNNSLEPAVVQNQEGPSREGRASTRDKRTRSSSSSRSRSRSTSLARNVSKRPATGSSLKTVGPPASSSNPTNPAPNSAPTNTRRQTASSPNSAGPSNPKHRKSAPAVADPLDSDSENLPEVNPKNLESEFKDGRFWCLEPHKDGKTRSYTASDNLKRHQKEAHLCPKLKCPLCPGLTFTRDASLIRHNTHPNHLRAQKEHDEKNKQK